MDEKKRGRVSHPASFATRSNFRLVSSSSSSSFLLYVYNAFPKVQFLRKRKKKIKRDLATISDPVAYANTLAILIIGISSEKPRVRHACKEGKVGSARCFSTRRRNNENFRFYYILITIDQDREEEEKEGKNVDRNYLLPFSFLSLFLLTPQSASEEGEEATLKKIKRKAVPTQKLSSLAFGGPAPWGSNYQFRNFRN